MPQEQSRDKEFPQQTWRSAAAAIIGLVSQGTDRLARRLNDRDRSSSMGTDLSSHSSGRRSFLRRSSSAASWSIPTSDRPELPFGQGGIAQVFNCLPQLRIDSPGAAIALVHYVTMHRPHTDQKTERDREKAGNELTRLLCQIRPNQASMISAKDRLTEMLRSSSERGRLTAELTNWEQAYLQLVHGEPNGHTIDEITQQFVQISRGLQEADSERRQASARIMLADLYLMAGQIGRADKEIAAALALIGQVYPAKEMTDLARSVDSSTAQSVVSRHQGSGQSASGYSGQPTASTTSSSTSTTS